MDGTENALEPGDVLPAVSGAVEGVSAVGVWFCCGVFSVGMVAFRFVKTLCCVLPWVLPKPNQWFPSAYREHIHVAWVCDMQMEMTLECGGAQRQRTDDVGASIHAINDVQYTCLFARMSSGPFSFIKKRTELYAAQGRYRERRMVFFHHMPWATLGLRYI